MVFCTQSRFDTLDDAFRSRVGSCFALLRAPFMFDRHEANARGREHRMGAGANRDALLSVLFFRHQPPVIHGLRDEPADVRVHPPCRCKQNSPIGRDGRERIEQVIECRTARTARMHPFRGCPSCI
jgi:hypothetical protein